VSDLKYQDLDYLLVKSYNTTIKRCHARFYYVEILLNQCKNMAAGVSVLVDFRLKKVRFHY